MSNRIKSKSPEIDLRPEQVMCRTLGESMVKAAGELQLQISGQAVLEGEDPVGEPMKLVVLYSAFPNGDLVIWFLYKGYYSLMALVNQKFRHLANFPVTEAEKFQAMLTELQGKLGK